MGELAFWVALGCLLLGAGVVGVVVWDVVVSRRAARLRAVRRCEAARLAAVDRRSA